MLFCNYVGYKRKILRRLAPDLIRCTGSHRTININSRFVFVYRRNISNCIEVCITTYLVLYFFKYFVIRNAGVGTTLTCSRIGSMIAPFVSALSSYALELPLLVLGLCALIEALLLLPLPETKDIALPDTITDVQHNEGYLVFCFGF